MNIFLKIGEILFKSIGIILILIVLILEFLTVNNSNKKEKIPDKKKQNLKFTPIKHIRCC